MSATAVVNRVGVHETSRGPYIVTFRGHKFYPLDIRPSDIDIRDIAHSLSMQCRFGGHTKWHYSVGQHSILVSKELELMGYPQYALGGLVHDGSETYLVDVPRPIKLIADFSTYRNIESTTQTAIYRKYGIIRGAKVQEILDVADNLLLAKEAFHLMNNPYWCHSMPKSKQKINPMEPKDVEKAFLKRFKELCD